MAAEPVETFVGWTAIGFGIMFVYSAISGKSFIKEILGPALTSGKIPSFKPSGGSVPASAKQSSVPTPSLPVNLTSQPGFVFNSGVIR